MEDTVFYSPVVRGDIVEFSPEESWHCAKVLRLKAGEVIGYTDGEGLAGTASLLEVSPKLATARILDRSQQAPRSFRLHMAVAPTKNIDRFEWFLEKATEMGIEEITPIICAQSERTVVKPERLHKILVAAMKQSRRAWLPVLHDAVKFRDFMKTIDGATPGYVAHCAPGQKIPLRDVYTPGSDALILIGPEGDFNEEEVQMAMDKGMQAISLGEYRLRTETAALVACMGVNFINNEV
ncbi:MAG: 16S rRNA (uracil(1498)-N(3))-methyltransferase [Bacteroidota bacterium]